MYRPRSILVRNASLHSVEHLSLLRRQEKFESLGNISGLLLLLSLKVFYKWRPTISFSNSLQSLEFKVFGRGDGREFSLRMRILTSWIGLYKLSFLGSCPDPQYSRQLLGLCFCSCSWQCLFKDPSAHPRKLVMLSLCWFQTITLLVHESLAL
jgi:hypothetical protein